MKVGKTSLVSKFNKVLILAFEAGYNALHNVHVQPIKTWGDWKSVVRQFCTKKEIQERFETVAIDTVDQAWSLCVKYICNQNGIEKLGDLPYGQGYDLAKSEFEQPLRDLAFSGVGISFISHSTEKTFKNEKGEDYTQIVPALPSRPYDIVNKMVDIIGYIREVKSEKGSNRYIFLRGDDRFLAGSRYSYIKPRIDLSYDALVDALYEAIDEEVKMSGIPSTEEKNEFYKKTFSFYMTEARELWNSAVKQNKNQEILKILETTFGKPTKFSEITEEQEDLLIKVISEIKELLS